MESAYSFFGVVNTTAQSGPPTFPATALSLRLKLLPHSTWSIKAAVSDGEPRGRHVNWDIRRGNRSFWIGEMDYVVSDHSVSGFDSRSHVSRSETTS